MRIPALSPPRLPATSYQTSPLIHCAVALRERAAGLFRRVSDRIGSARARECKGSFKIIVYEAGKGKINGTDPLLEDASTC